MNTNGAKVSNADDTMSREDGKDVIVHHILCSIEENASLSQRQLARQLDIALGSVNWYLKRCINKGLIKIKEVPLKRYYYYLTPHGFEEKSRLTAQFLKDSFQIFRLGRSEALDILRECKKSGFENIYLIGDGDLAEIYILSSYEVKLQIKAIIDADGAHKERISIPVLPSSEVKGTDNKKTVFIITNMIAPSKAYRDILKLCEAESIPEQQILIPKMVNFRPYPVKRKEMVG